MPKYWWRVLSTCPAPITWIAVITILALTLKIFLFNSLPAPFEAWHAFGLLIEAILASIIAAYVFFLLSVHAPKVEEKYHVTSSIVAKLAHAASYNMTGFLQLIEHDQTPQGTRVNVLDREKVDLQKVTTLFKAVKPNDPVSMIDAWNSTSRLTAMQAMVKHDEWCNQNIEKIWRFIAYLEPNVVNFLYGIQESVHSLRMKDYRQNWYQVGLSNADISTYAEEYFNYYRMAVELDKYFARLASAYDPSKRG